MPAAVFVSRDANYTVTFDDWGTMGFGNAVMAYYDSRGKLVKQYTLEELSPFPPEEYTGVLRRSGGGRISGSLTINGLKFLFLSETELPSGFAT